MAAAASPPGKMWPGPAYNRRHPCRPVTRKGHCVLAARPPLEARQQAPRVAGNGIGVADAAPIERLTTTRGVPV